MYIVDLQCEVSSVRRLKISMFSRKTFVDGEDVELFHLKAELKKLLTNKR